MGAAGKNHFDAGSVPDNYRRYLEPVLFAPWAERFVGWAGVHFGDVVLDLAAEPASSRGWRHGHPGQPAV